MNNFILEVPEDMNYTIHDIQRIMDFSDELCVISEMVNSTDKELNVLGEELLKSLKDVTK